MPFVIWYLKQEEGEKGKKAATAFITERGQGSENNILRLSWKQGVRMATMFVKNRLSCLVQWENNYFLHPDAIHILKTPRKVIAMDAMALWFCAKVSYSLACVFSSFIYDVSS